MSADPELERRLAQWGERLFYGMPPAGRKGGRDPKLTGRAVREHVRAAVSPRATEVMVKITSGGKGMKTIAAHLRYISRQGKPEVGGKGETLEIEDERGAVFCGAAAVKDIESAWRHAGSFIPDVSHRKESFHLILSMPAGTPAEFVRDSAREFAQETFGGHKYVFVLHEDTDSPHVHLAVRAERIDGVRLNPRKADLRAWRQRFAERLQERGVVAVATSAAARGQQRAPQTIWRLKTAGEVRKPRPDLKTGAGAAMSRQEALRSWQGLGHALAASEDRADQRLAAAVREFVEKKFTRGEQVPPGLGPRWSP